MLVRKAGLPSFPNDRAKRTSPQPRPGTASPSLMLAAEINQYSLDNGTFNTTTVKLSTPALYTCKPKCTPWDCSPPGSLVSQGSSFDRGASILAESGAGNTLAATSPGEAAGRDLLA
jgi:hypothetical protein